MRQSSRSSSKLDLTNADREAILADTRSARVREELARARRPAYATQHEALLAFIRLMQAVELLGRGREPRRELMATQRMLL